MRDQGPHSPGFPPPGDGWERPPAPVTRGRFGEPRPGANGPQGASHPNGHHVAGGPAGRRFAEPDEDGHVDLVELQADDELINALSSGLGVSGPGRQGYDADDHLVAMLASWKADVDVEPIPELVGTDEAVQMLQPARPSRKVGFLRPLVAAAAVAACALAVVSISAHEAQPGDALWGVTRVLYSEHAQQVQAQSDLREGIERVNARLAAGDTAGAQQELASFGPLVDRVGPDQLSYFAEQQRFLTAKASEATPGVPTDPQAPLRDGTPAPPPPATSEGGSDEPQEPAPSQPESGSPSPGGTGGPTGSTGPGGSGSPSSPDDPQVLQGPGEQGTSSPTTPSDPPESSPSTEGSADPTTTPSSTRPTAAGEGAEDPSDPDRTTSPSSTTSGAVSSTPN